MKKLLIGSRLTLWIAKQCVIDDIDGLVLEDADLYLLDTYRRADQFSIEISDYLAAHL